MRRVSLTLNELSEALIVCVVPFRVTPGRFATVGAVIVRSRSAPAVGVNVAAAKQTAARAQVPRTGPGTRGRARPGCRRAGCVRSRFNLRSIGSGPDTLESCERL